MTDDNPDFSVRSLGNGTDYVIDVLWSDGANCERGWDPHDEIAMFAEAKNKIAVSPLTG
jgi:hypothetical protein